MKRYRRINRRQPNRKPPNQGESMSKRHIKANDRLIYENELPPDIPETLYAAWFRLSSIVDGVRMGPPVRYGRKIGYYILH